MKPFAEQIEKIAHDLINLEVNTIIKPNMTGRKMPAPRHALIDIALNYKRKLFKLGFPLKTGEGIRMGGKASFGMIREEANQAAKILVNKAEKEKLSPEDEVNLVFLYRIESMSDQIKGIFNALEKRKVLTWDNDYTREEIESQHPPFPLITNEIILIRKIWDMGLEEIAMQTVIQLDGDVLTRIQPRHANERSAMLHQIHNENVAISIRFWKELIEVLKDFFKSFSKLFPTAR
ncbi:hypothetical protein QUF80_11125 [Desulfococcaceae bacterium HSG8]|nr:hypothetical protein [Desulfococcaceae bacterium HSG8]